MIPRRLALLAPAALAACQQTPASTPSIVDTILGMREAGIILNIEFAFNSYAIPDSAAGTIEALAAAMVDPRLARYGYTVNGHTDVVGRLGYNLALSELRAAAVVDALAARGVPRERMRKQGFGPLRLLVPEDPRNGRNRRVEIYAIPPT